MTTTTDDWPTILPKRALDYFRVMCARWDQVIDDTTKLMHLHELTVRLPPSARSATLKVISDAHLELLYTLDQKMYRLTGRFVEGALRTTLEEVREVSAASTDPASSQLH
jgi:hypothetical protein